MKTAEAYIFSGCERLDISNGHLNSTDTRVGTVVSVECHTGYKLVGSKRRECLSSKTWSGETACSSMKCLLAFTKMI